MDDLDPLELENFRNALLDGVGASPRGHQPTAAEKALVYARYAALRERHYGPVPARERLSGPRNSLAAESPLIRKLFGSN